jgi:hypothetical protein
MPFALSSARDRWAVVATAVSGALRNDKRGDCSVVCQRGVNGVHAVDPISELRDDEIQIIRLDVGHGGDCARNPYGWFNQD